MLVCFVYVFSNEKPRGCLLILVAPRQQMERRFDSIHERRERATGRQVHEVEEQVAPPRGRQNRGNHGHHNQRHRQPQEENIPIIEEVHEEGEDEVE